MKLFLHLRIAIALGAILIGIASYKIFHLSKDNVIEEACEKVIKDQTGIKVDLSPENTKKVDYKGMI